MAEERLSMREASKLLGVSQLRVRELIRKGTLVAEKVADEAGERWSILNSSIRDFQQRRQDHVMTSGPANSAQLTSLVKGLEEQLGRVRSLIQEITKAQAYLDGLRSAQKTIERELAPLRQRITEIKGEIRQATSPARPMETPTETPTAGNGSEPEVEAKVEEVEAKVEEVEQEPEVEAEVEAKVEDRPARKPTTGSSAAKKTTAKKTTKKTAAKKTTAKKTTKKTTKRTTKK